MVIFSVKQKRNAAIALMAVSLVYGVQSFATIPQETNTGASATGDADSINASESGAIADKRSYLKQVYADIKDFVSKSKQKVNSFFDTKNKESYSKHIENLGNQLNDITKKVIQPIRDELSSKPLVHDEQYYKIVRKTDEIISELYNNLQIIHSALGAQTIVKDVAKNKQPGPVINALKSIQQKIALNLNKIEKDINELHNMTIKYDADLAKDVTQLKEIFIKVKNSDPNFATALIGIMHRVKC